MYSGRILFYLLQVYPWFLYPWFSAYLSSLFPFFELKKRKRGLHVLDATGSKKNARIKASEKIMIKLQS